ncbi:MAG TPA: multicopper oxidase family protein, partial [Solirubrobacteraceae bacterium]|nr:multicopper oxidase family protein [Solirubrobacteraceae bacterium]
AEAPVPAAAAAPAEGPRRGIRPWQLGIVGALLAAAVAAAVVLATGGGSTTSKEPSCAAHFPALIRDGFPEPPMRFSTGGVLDTTLSAAPATIPIDGKPVQVMEYDGSLPAPTLVLCPGDRLTVHLNNQLPLPTNLHVHGLHVSPAGNGDNVFVSIPPAQAFTYHYQLPADHPAGAFWYHPHFHTLVQAETGAGLAGAIVVAGGLDNLLPKIPQRLIVIQGGKETPQPGFKAVIPGLKPGQFPPPLPGPVELLTNGAADPQALIRPGEIQRWRIFNATSERFLHLQMPGQTFEVLARDGNTLHSMLPQGSLLIGPGSRVEVLVRGGPPGSYPLTAIPFQQCFKNCFDPIQGIPDPGRATPLKTVLTMVSRGAPVNEPMPAAPLANPVDLRGLPVAVHRTIFMVRQLSTTGPPTFPFNGHIFDPNRVDVVMKLGAVEEWTLENPITRVHDEWHTFHIHTNPFQVMSVNGHARSFVDYQDNVNLAPGSTVVIRMRPLDFTGKTVFHCHLTFHEDHGMLGVIDIEANPTPAQTNADTVLRIGAPVDVASTVGPAASASTASAFTLFCPLLASAASRVSVALGGA